MESGRKVIVRIGIVGDGDVRIVIVCVVIVRIVIIRGW